MLERFKLFFLNNKFVIFMLVLLLIGLNIFVFNKISFIFNPLTVLIRTVLLPIILAGVFYYLLNPLVNLLERYIKRGYAILILYLLMIGLLSLLIVTVIPLVRQQITGLINNFPTYSEQLVWQFEQFVGSQFVHQLQQSINLSPSDIVSSLSEQATTILNNAWSGIGGFLGVVTEIILAIVTLPFILFYLLKDGKKLPSYFLKFMPVNLRGQLYTVMTEMNHQISSYIRGQIIVSFCIGFLLFIGYQIIGLEYSLVLASIAAFTAVVPYLGPAIAITPALIVALVTSPIMLIKMIVVWTIVQLVEGKFISPQIMGKTLQVHPITIIFVILTAGNLFGVAGVLMAVPGYAVLKVVVSHLFRWFKVRSKLYEEEQIKESPQT
ncbi:AI-2E family transporter [Paenibacillus senegalensis]|uniref:AI-2E family transporter n=1 Tax=Paenibacillus senegalensis TaxID=1465766 RepID=UPI000289242D|nr:AI-2E family transporter [Paenibacillus senegalensis]